MNIKYLILTASATLLTSCSSVKHHNATSSHNVPDQVIAHQRSQLIKNTKGMGFGPQSPRDINSNSGNNDIIFSVAPTANEMNLCNIHFHKNAEHRGGQFSKYSGNGDSHGHHTGYTYSGHLTQSELLSIDKKICPNSHGDISPGDTIEVHYVYSSAKVKPGPTMAACFSDSVKNPKLRVEAQVYVVVNDKNALNFGKLTEYGVKNNFYQALGIPNNTGKPIQYIGSTTGPDFNEKGSPTQVTWSVRPKVAKINIETLGEWCKGNIFDEDHAHGVRNLIINHDLLSKIKQ